MWSLQRQVLLHCGLVRACPVDSHDPSFANEVASLPPLAEDHLPPPQLSRSRLPPPGDVVRQRTCSPGTRSASPFLIRGNVLYVKSVC
jgi:hypothetical protein